MNSSTVPLKVWKSIFPTRSNNKIFLEKTCCHAFGFTLRISPKTRFLLGILAIFLQRETRRVSRRLVWWQLYGHMGILRFSRTLQNDFLRYKYQYFVEIAEGVNTNERYILYRTHRHTHLRTKRKNRVMCGGYWKSWRVFPDTMFTRWLDYGVYMHWWVRLIGFQFW